MLSAIQNTKDERDVANTNGFDSKFISNYKNGDDSPIKTPKFNGFNSSSVSQLEEKIMSNLAQSNMSHILNDKQKEAS